MNILNSLELSKSLLVTYGFCRQLFFLSFSDTLLSLYRFSERCFSLIIHDVHRKFYCLLFIITIIIIIIGDQIVKCYVCLHVFVSPYSISEGLNTIHMIVNIAIKTSWSCTKWISSTRRKYQNRSWLRTGFAAISSLSPSLIRYFLFTDSLNVASL
jgi:hypothetical protein